MQGSAQTEGLTGALRALASALRTMRLYPATSPIPLEAAQSASAAFEAWFAITGQQVAALAITREGIVAHGDEPVGAFGALADLAETLRERGAAEIAVTRAPDASDILDFVAVLSLSVDEVRSRGGLSNAVGEAGVVHISVTDIRLVTSDDAATRALENGLDTWLQDLSGDPDRFGTWYAAASATDPVAFEDGLLEVARAAGELGSGLFDTTLAAAFVDQDSVAKDALLTRAAESPELRNLVARMFKEMTAQQIAESLVGGTLGANMLSLSHALTSLPLGTTERAVTEQVKALARTQGRSVKELDFLGHMIEARAKTTPEPALIESDSAYRAVSDAAGVTNEDVDKARGVVVSSRSALHRAGIRTMLAMLDQQRDFGLYCETIDALVALVPGLVEAGELQLAGTVVSQIVTRQSANTAPWPELTERMDAALQGAAGPRTTKALILSVMEDRTRLQHARELLALLGERAGQTLVAEAITLKGEGIEVAERLLGDRRTCDLLAAGVAQAEWHQLEPVVSRLARERDPACTAAVDALLNRPDVRSRREVALGLAKAAAPAPSRLLARGLRDTDPQNAAIVAHGIASCGVPGSADLLCARLDELSIDGSDFALSKELIAALGETPEDAAGTALDRLAARRSLMKRGHFADVQAAVERAREQRAAGGDVG